jgi:hypothetical protein
MANLKSPFQCGGAAKTFPALKIPKRLIIRVDDADATAKIYISLNGKTPAADNAQYFLNAGESLELCSGAVPDMSHIQAIDASDDPLIFWSLE